MTNYKFSEKAFYEALIASPIAMTIKDTEYTADEIADFAKAKLNAIVEQYAKRSVKRSEKKADENAVIEKAILGVVKTEPMTISDIAINLLGAYSVQKLSPILKNMADNGSLTRTVGKDKRVAYSL